MKGSLAEMSVIGGLIAYAEENDCGSAFGLLKPEMFESRLLGNTFSVCDALRKAGKRIDIVSVEAQVGQEYRMHLVKCIQTMPAFSGFDDYVAAVLESWRVRTLQATALELTQCTTSKSWSETAERILNQQRAIDSGLKDATASDFWGCVMKFWDEQQRPTSAVKTGHNLLDAITGGFQCGGFYVIAGRSGKGKTDFSITLATNISAKYRVTYLTMEMKKEQLTGIISSRVAQVDGAKIRDKTMTVEESDRVMLAQGRMKDYTQLSMDDQLGITVEDVENKILKQRPDILFIDHVGLMNHGKFKNKWEGVENTSLRLKQLAMKHNIPIVGLVQETKDNGLKGSDNLNNDADGIFFMKSEPPKTFIQGNAWIDAEVIIAKNRYGGCGTLKYHWRPQYHEWRQVDDRR